MKYCPYCGAGLPNGAVSFCPECGKALPDRKENGVRADEKKHESVKGKNRSKTREKKTSKPVSAVSIDKESAVDDDYDGYYEDILPMDIEREEEGIDRSIVKKVAVLIGGLVFIIGICVALMYLL